jgi:hypothetical protein
LLSISLSWWNFATGGLYDNNCVHLIACRYHDRTGFSTWNANVQNNYSQAGNRRKSAQKPFKGSNLRRS